MIVDICFIIVSILLKLIYQILILHITNMNYMFFQCTSLTSLDLSNFNTSNAQNMRRFFVDVHPLISLDLSNFDTSNIKDMSFMFAYCSSLTSLNLSNFDTSQVLLMENMFYQCINLEYINLYKFKGNNSLHVTDIFVCVPENIVICIDEFNIGEKSLQKIPEIKCYTLTCSIDWKLKQKKIIIILMNVLKDVKTIHNINMNIMGNAMKIVQMEA